MILPVRSPAIISKTRHVWDHVNKLSSGRMENSPMAIKSSLLGTTKKAASPGLPLTTAFHLSSFPRTIIENNAKSTGVVRAMARSDHCRWVSKPRCARISSNVVSTFHLSTNQFRICCALAVRSVAKKASVRSSPAGSRTTTHLIGSGLCPVYTREKYRRKFQDRVLKMAKVEDYIKIWFVIFFRFSC